MDVAERDSLDIETVKKVVSTIACLYGDWATVQSSGRHLDDLKNDEELCCRLWEQMQSSQLFRASKKFFVILFLEGEFGSYSTTRFPQKDSKEGLMRKLRESIQKKLSWLPCVVDVVDSRTYYTSRTYHKLSSGYTVELHPHTP